MKLIRRVLLACLPVLLLTFSAAQAADSNSPVLKRITDSGTLRVGMSAAQPPFNMKADTGEVIGLDVDLAKLLARAMQVELEIVEMPFNELVDAVESGKVDLALSGMTSTLSRNMRVAFVGPYFVSGKSILTKSSTLAAIQSPEQMNQERLKIAALAGSTSEDFVKAVLQKPALTTTATLDEAVQLLLNNEVEAVVADQPTCVVTQLRYPDAGLATLKNPLTVEPIGIAVPAGDALYLNLIDNYFKAAAATGALEALQQKWFGNGDWLAVLP